jgi:vacuolar-type H+-ATPase subunit I/STV1
MKSFLRTPKCTFMQVFIFIFFSLHLYAQPVEEEKPVTLESAQERIEQIQITRRSRINTVKTANFYLRTGKPVFGKVVFDDRNNITIEELEGSSIVVNTYSKRDFDARSLNIRSVPEAKHYTELGEYFSGRTWDFENDPDDFIQAIRCYEKAKRSLLENSEENSEKIEEIDEAIKKIEADREVWKREAESRAKLMELEFGASLADKIKGLESKLEESTEKIDRGLAELHSKIKELKDRQETLKTGVIEINEDVAEQLNAIRERVEANRETINYLDDLLRRYPRRTPRVKQGEDERE